jgi:hypothetical protein
MKNQGFSSMQKIFVRCGFKNGQLFIDGKLPARNKKQCSEMHVINLIKSFTQNGQWKVYFILPAFLKLSGVIPYFFLNTLTNLVPS